MQANLQVLLSHLAFGMDIQSAIEAPRLITHSHPDSFAPHASDPGRLTIEGRVPEAVTDALAGRGHRVERLAPWTHKVAGCVRGSPVPGRRGLIEAASDPRRTSRSLAR